ncbi:hypothetical protein [Fictibacillus phosphorivorans]|uniref:hypothetical protein n=1 Tax=Fictibacillus phosphorivorans TaxID=1221500 RepID=UPI0035EA6CFB
MEQFILGLLIGVVFFILLGVAGFIGYKIGRKSPSKLSNDPVTDKEKRKAEALSNHFANLMHYDIDKALQRKKVNE